MLDYRLYVFRKVAEEQSLSRAARALNISQPAVTQHIKHLEELVQTSLFNRSSSGVTLTEAGLVFLEHAQQVEMLHEQTLQKIKVKGGGFSGTIRLGASTTITQYFLPGILTAIKAKFANVVIDVSEGNSESVISGLLTRRIDLGLIEARCRRRDLRVQPFLQDEIIVIAPPNHPLAQQTNATLQEVIKEPLILREMGSGTRLTVEAELKKRSVLPSQLLVLQDFPSTEGIKRMVAGGSGLGFVSRISVEKELKAGTLKQIYVPGLSIVRPFSAILPLGPDPVGLRQLFLGFLKDGRK